MSIEILTKQDLQEFKSELIQEMKDFMQPGCNVNTKKWLRSIEVRDLLKISTGTLQTLRVSGKLKHTRIGSIIYYDQDDIQKLLQENKTQTSKL